MLSNTENDYTSSILPFIVCTRVNSLFIAPSSLSIRFSIERSAGAASVNSEGIGVSSTALIESPVMSAAQVSLVHDELKPHRAT